jgi:hypothetical protein
VAAENPQGLRISNIAARHDPDPELTRLMLSEFARPERLPLPCNDEQRRRAIISKKSAPGGCFGRRMAAYAKPFGWLHGRANALGRRSAIRTISPADLGSTTAPPMVRNTTACERLRHASSPAALLAVGISAGDKRS